MSINKIIQAVTQKIINRSMQSREHYLQQVNKMKQHGIVERAQLSCTNLAHVAAAAHSHDKNILIQLQQPNIGIVSAYNDMLSAHQPYKIYPDLLKNMVSKFGATAQVASGVPAMCDGITQGQLGMELSLLSRDVIAMSTAVALSHNTFDGVLCLGICDKIVPGLLIGALQFGHLPCIFVPSGPMSSGISNAEKAKNRTLFASGKLSEKDLLQSEMKSYHSPGTCVFYGTANSNQMLMEVMGLHIPGAAFVPPYSQFLPIDVTCERHLYNELAAQHIVENTKNGGNYTPLAEIVNEKSLVNAIVMLLATGGSTNHTIHIPAIAKSCGINILWDDFAEISAVVPLIAKIYPNGPYDINQFHQAGGVSFVIDQLLKAKLLHDDIKTVVGQGLAQYAKTATIAAAHHDQVQFNLQWHDANNDNLEILKSVQQPFSNSGGLKIIKTIDNVFGQGIAKISALKPQQLYVKAPIRVFYEQDDVMIAYKNGELYKDVVIVLLFQGPKFRGMPELHGLMPAFVDIQNSGYKIALVTDGRLSGASGSVPAVIHLSPEVTLNRNLAKLKDGDMMIVDLEKGMLALEGCYSQILLREEVMHIHDRDTLGRQLFFKVQSACMTDAHNGATIF
jgi:phosphogluconate dehydratase